MATVAYAQALVPAFGALTDAQVQVWLDQATKVLSSQPYIDASVSELYVDAVVYYAAHLAEMTPGVFAASASTATGASGGPVTGGRSDRWSYSKGMPDSGRLGGDADSHLGETFYGRRYREIRRKAAIGLARQLLPVG